MRLLLGTALTVLSTVAAGLLVAPSTAPPAAAAGPASVALEGRGYGHGKGMSQYGAKGAADRGLTHLQIVNFYYPGTRIGSATGSIRVKITAETRDAMVIAHRSGLTVRDVSTGASWPLRATGARRWRITRSADNATSRVWVDTGTWRLVRRIPGAAEFAASSMRIYLPSGSAVYRGRLRSAPVGTGRDVVNVLPLEGYLRGVVPLEMPALWAPHAVRAQAVAARTYAAHERATANRGHFDVYDTTQSQVYGGVGAEHSASTAAISATRGEIRAYGGKPAFTQFSSSNGGWTVAGSVAYLPARQDPYDPVNPWTQTVPATAIERAWPAIGDFQELVVVERDGHGAWGGRATKVRIRGANATITRTGSDVRSALGLRSTWFRKI